MDKQRTYQILINLIQNAIKFSKRLQEVIVKVECCVRVGNIVSAQISVSDHGIGISEQDQRNLFKPFFKTTDERSRILN